MINKIIAHFLLLLLTVTVLRGQTSPGSRLHLERVASDLGLSQNLITCILQDRKGFMWFGT
ncbi:MAG: two-component regulator propeller domain-containing protein, partial [bacterium]